MATGLLLLGVPGCGKSKPSSSSIQAPDSVLSANSDTSRFIPRRANPLVITNRIILVQQQAPAVTNTAPAVTCGAPQSVPCMSPDGTQATLTAHVEDADGNPLSVTWSVDGRERYAQQVPAGGPPTTADLSFVYNFTPGDHAVKVTVSDGSLSATCDTTMTFQKDTQNPVIVCPRDISLPPDPGTCSAVVTFSPKATDNCPDVAVVCDPPSGTAFPIGTTTVTCTATDTSGNASDCAFAVVVQVTNRCPQTEAFWRQNLGAWPVSSLTLGNQVYSRSQLVPLLRASVPADASMVLARQLIAASLNAASGSDPRPICNELAQANTTLAGFTGKLPFRVGVSSAAGRAMMEVSIRLSAYNSGIISFNCLP
jgi:HYR domain